MALAIPLLLAEVAQSPQRLQRGQSRGFRDPPVRDRSGVTLQPASTSLTAPLPPLPVYRCAHSSAWMALSERYGGPLDSCFDSAGRRGPRRERPPSVLFPQRDPVLLCFASSC